SYMQGLQRLLPVVRAQLSQGDWSAHEDGHFKKAWFRCYRDNYDSFYLAPHIILKRDCQTFIAVDPAGGTSDVADYTAMVVFAVAPPGDLLVLVVVRERIGVEDIVPRLKDLCGRWEPSFVVMEGNFLQSAYVRQARATRGIPTVNAVTPGGQSKLVRAVPAV